MKLLLALVGAGVVALSLTGAAGAMPPTLLSVTHEDRHPVATFSAPHADLATIYFATKPDRATDGSFLSENITTLDFLADDEIQSGRWLGEDRLDPGTYWVMLRASPDFDACYDDVAGFLSTCADGYSNVVVLTVPKPLVRYSARVTAYRYSRVADLELTANPLGEKLPYRVCYRLKSGKGRCVNGSLDGYSWESSASDSLTVSTRSLAAVTTFTWYVAGQKVAARRVRVR